MKTSEKIEQIALALNKAQAVMEGAKRTSENPFYRSRYAELSEVWDTCRKPLTDNGLSFVQSISTDKEYFTGKVPLKTRDGEIRGEREAIYVWLSVTSRLLHVSEQYIEDTVSMPVEADPQSIGKCTTYIRRYAQMALCGIAPEDDDGESSKHPSDKSPSELTKKTQTQTKAGTEPNICPIHKVAMREYKKGDQHWFSHKLEDGTWCSGDKKKSADEQFDELESAGTPSEPQETPQEAQQTASTQESDVDAEPRQKYVLEDVKAMIKDVKWTERTALAWIKQYCHVDKPKLEEALDACPNKELQKFLDQIISMHKIR